MKTFYYLWMAVSALQVALPALAEDIVVRLVDVKSGTGVRNCDVALASAPNDHPTSGQMSWLTRIFKTTADGRVRFSLKDPLPSAVNPALVDVDCPSPCGNVHAVSVDQILRTGVVMTELPGQVNERGVHFCSPNYKKLEEIAARPGEILIFVQKHSGLERVPLH